MAAKTFDLATTNAWVEVGNSADNVIVQAVDGKFRLAVADAGADLAAVTGHLMSLKSMPVANLTGLLASTSKVYVKSAVTGVPANLKVTRY